MNYLSCDTECSVSISGEIVRIERNAIEPPVGESKNDLRRERTREQILEAARIALVDVGYEHITTRRIAEAAGVNIAALHYYFGSKEALLAEAVQYALERSIRKLRAVTADAPDAATALERTFQLTWEMVKDRPGMLRYDLAVRGMRDAKVHQQVTVIYGALHTLVREILQQHTEAGHRLASGLTVEILCYYLVAAIDGVILQHLIFRDDTKTIGSLQLILQHAKSMLVVSTPDESDFSVMGI